MNLLPFLALSASSLLMKFIMVLFVLTCIVLVLVVLIQKGRGGGLSGAFGGGAAGGILGSKTGDFLTWFTVGIVGVFLTLAIVMAKFYRPVVHDTGEAAPVQQTQPVQTQQQSQPESTEQPAIPEATGETESSDANL